MEYLNIRELFSGLYKFCECPCGTLIPIFNTLNKPARFKNGHNTSLRKGDKNPMWKGGRRKNGNYWRLYIPDYFSADMNGNVYEHVYFYQEYNKCCICKWAEIHHIIPVTEGYCNNMPWNLQAVTKAEHRKITHIKDMRGYFCSDCGSKKTWIKKDNGRPHWFNDDKGGHWCLRCSQKRYRKQERLNKKN